MNRPAEMIKQTQLVLVSRTLPGDLETPISAFLKLCPTGAAFLLESADGGEQIARYSFLGYNPYLTLKGYGRRMEFISADGLSASEDITPFAAVREVMRTYAQHKPSGLPRFTAGAVGYFGYDVSAEFEPIGGPNADDLQLPDTYLQFMQNIVIFDHFTHKLVLVANRPLAADESLQAVKVELELQLQEMKQTLSQPLVMAHEEVQRLAAAVPVGNMSREAFIERVKAAKAYIEAGEVFQIVLSQRFAASLQEEPFSLYRKLRSLNPSPYMFYLNFDDVALVGASPEMLVRVEGRTVTTRPIAGTRKRGSSEEEDKLLADELLADPKEMAEHIMLVDLGRNDIGRVARFGTVEVKEYAKIERFSHVMHLTSEVTGELAPNKDMLDALQGCFPAGTLSGAPKVRAMQIINELEPSKRGPYGGAVGYLDFSGNLDTCITIRTMVIKNGIAYMQTGAGIVADSVPEVEYQETLDKAKATFAALGVK